MASRTGIHVYGTDWCGLTFIVREYLTNARVDYDYFDIENDPRADEFVRTTNKGSRRCPVVVLDEHTVTNPTLAELGRLLRNRRDESRSAAGANTRRTGDL